MADRVVRQGSWWGRQALTLILFLALAAWAQGCAGPSPLTEAEMEEFMVTISDSLRAGFDKKLKKKIIFDEHGWNKKRLLYVTDRIVNSLKVIKGKSSLEDIEAKVRPTAEEVELVRRYEARLDKLAQEMAQRPR